MFDRDEIDILNDFLKKSNTDLERKLGIYWADGYLCAINSSPNIIMASEWHGDLIDQGYKFESEQQCYKIYELLMSFYNNINAHISNETYIPIYEWYETKGQTKLESAATWADGYSYGTMFATEEFLIKEIIELFLPIIILSGIIPEITLKKIR